MPFASAREMPGKDDIPLYFENLTQLDEWYDRSSRPISGGLPPYIPRTEPQEGSFAGKLLICHDYKGGYTETPSAQAYTFNFWDRCDTFIYFSHQRVTIPPPGWVNAAHRQGVKMLGVLIFEHDQSAEDNVRLLLGKLPRSRTGSALSHTISGLPISAHYATVLADLAYERGFDGYLVNAEHPLTGRADQTRAFEAWVSLLRQELKHILGPHAQTIWYDSIVPTGDVAWQNRLNSRNLGFFLASDSLFTNYFWHWTANSQIAEYLLNIDERLFQGRHKSLRDIFVGIDLWGRGSHGGGGFGAFKALEHIDPQTMGLSSAIFGPAWTWEDGEGSEGRTWETWWDRERTLWVGPRIEGTLVELPDAPQKRGEPPCTHEAFKPLCNFFPRLAPPDPLVLPFWTTFSPGVGYSWFVEGERVMFGESGWTDVDKQTSIGDLLWPRPQVSWDENISDEKPPQATSRLVFDDAFNGGSSIVVSLDGEGSSTAEGFRCFWIPIQTLSLTPGQSYELQVVYKIRNEGAELEPALSVRAGLETDGFKILAQPSVFSKHDWEFLKITCHSSADITAGSLCEVGLILGGVFEDPSANYSITLKLGQLTAAPKSDLEGVTPYQMRLLWADCQPTPSNPDLLNVTWEPSISYTLPPTLCEFDLHPEVTRPPWLLDRSESWFPRILYANIYIQVRKPNALSSMYPSQDAAFLGTSGWGSGSWFGSGPNGFTLRREEVLEGLRNGPVRFYVQPMTDRGELLGWDNCAFVDYDW